MDRRTTLASLAALASHALLPQLLEAWGQTPVPAPGGAPWQPRAVTPAGGAQLAALVDAILPDTDTPGARAAGVHVFVDLAVAECLPAAERDAFRTGLDGLNATCRSAHGVDLDRATPAAVATLLRDAEAAGSPFVKALKGLTVLGYGTSRIGATQALADDQAPGRYRGCIDLAPGQRTWAATMTTRAQASHTYDAIVVGSGISGGWAAKVLTEGGLRTLVLERGRPVEHVKDYPTANLAPWELPHGNRATAQDAADSPIQSKLYLYGQDSKHFLVKDVEHPYNQVKPFQWFRGYHVGGRSLLWARHCFRWSDLDFEANAREGVGIDWPIRYKDIAPWYDVVERFIGVSGENAGLSQLPDGQLLPPFEMNCVEAHLKTRLPQVFGDRILIASRCAVLSQPHNGRGACQARNRCHRGCPHGAYFSSNSSTLPAAAATGRLTLRPFSIVHSVICDPNTGRAAGVRVIDAQTKAATDYFAKVVFLNASALATTGILLDSACPQHPNGFGNSSGVLGHYLMDHHAAVGAQGVHPGFADKYYSGRRSTSVYVPRFRNISARHDGFTRGYAYEVYTGRAGWKDRTDAPGIGADFKASLSKPGPWTLWMEGYGETLPRHENRVSLNREKRDQWGLPTLDIDMTYGPNEIAMRLDMAEQAAQITRAGGFENVSTFNETPIPGAVIHEMGTARMGADPKQSVVNRFNQLHDAPNVFVTDGACMTSTACQNPSLTYMALTARAATFAIDELKAGRL